VSVGTLKHQQAMTLENKPHIWNIQNLC
jgi:hypothetical protein